MTQEEQIKQSAEEYIQPLKVLPDADENITFIAAIREAYVAGAHSRDEEIEKCYNTLKLLPITIFDAETVNQIQLSVIHERDSQIQDLKREISIVNSENKYLKNSWIDANKQLPDEPDEDCDYHSKPVFVRVVNKKGKAHHTVAMYYFNNNEVPEDGWTIDLSNGSKVTHWMEIPEVVC